MPTYEYKCESCGHLFEAFQSITADPLTKCPQEGCKGPVRRLLSAGAGFLFKGDGFYITDYRSDSYKKAANAESGKTAPASSKTKSDTSSSSSSSSSSTSAPKSSGSSS